MSRKYPGYNMLDPHDAMEVAYSERADAIHDALIKYGGDFPDICRNCGAVFKTNTGCPECGPDQDIDQMDEDEFAEHIGLDIEPHNPWECDNIRDLD
jgi:hypothetical protein